MHFTEASAISPLLHQHTSTGKNDQQLATRNLTMGFDLVMVLPNGLNDFHAFHQPEAGPWLYPILNSEMSSSIPIIHYMLPICEDAKSPFSMAYVENDNITPLVKVIDGNTSTAERREERRKWERFLSRLQPPPIPLPGWEKPFPFQLEKFWINSFMTIFSEYYDQGDLWTLQPVDKAPDMNTFRKGSLPCGTYSLVHTAKIRFTCSKGCQGWTSMQGRVVFWFRFFDEEYSDGMFHGQVLFKLYGQKCNKCDSNKFETPLWYPEEIAVALLDLYLKIGRSIYGRPYVMNAKGLRQGKPNSHHQPELCQACLDGVCRVRKKAAVREA